jgi:predicted nucleotidyltransferase
MFEPVIAPVVERLRAAGVVRLGIFGSVARGESRPDSDVDALVCFSPSARSIDNLMTVGDALEQVFNRRVDLVTEDALSPYIAPHIMREIQYVDLGRCVPEAYSG